MSFEDDARVGVPVSVKFPTQSATSAGHDLSAWPHLDDAPEGVQWRVKHSLFVESNASKVYLELYDRYRFDPALDPSLLRLVGALEAEMLRSRGTADASNLQPPEWWNRQRELHAGGGSLNLRFPVRVLRSGPNEVVITKG